MSLELTEEQKKNLEEFRKHHKEMQNVDPRTVDRSTLVQRESIRIDPDGSREERILSYISQIKNPYCYLDGNTVVKIQFSETDTTIEDCFVNYLSGQ